MYKHQHQHEDEHEHACEKVRVFGDELRFRMARPESSLVQCFVGGIDHRRKICHPKKQNKKSEKNREILNKKQ